MKQQDGRRYGEKRRCAVVHLCSHQYAQTHTNTYPAVCKKLHRLEHTAYTHLSPLLPAVLPPSYLLSMYTGGGCLLFCLSKSCTSTRHNLTHTHSPYTPRVMSLGCVCVLEGEGWGQRRRTLLRLVELTLLPYDRTTKPPAGWELNPPRSPSALNKHTHKHKLRHMQTSHFYSPPPFLSLFLLIYAQNKMTNS